MDKRYLDKFGNMLFNSWDSQSENPTLANAAHCFSHIYFGVRYTLKTTHTAWYRTYKKYTTNNKTFRTMEFDENPSWSIDEKLAALAIFTYRKERVWIERIPYLPSWSNSSKWSWLVRLDVLLYQFGCRNPKLQKFIWPLIKLKIWTSIKDYLAHRPNEASGVHLGFVMAMGWGKSDYIKKHESIFRGAIHSYYAENQHPTKLLWTK